MGAVCAVVYLLAIIVFIPFPFYKDIVAATSGGGSKDVLLEVTDVNVGRHLHRFPHSKVRRLEHAFYSSEEIDQDPSSSHPTSPPSSRYNPLSY